MLVLLQEKDIHTGDLILVNGDHAYRESGRESRKLRFLAPQPEELQKDHPKVPETEAGQSVRMNGRAVDHLLRLLRKIHGQKQIVPVSGWRSFQEQQKIWDDSIKENGLAFTETYVAVPGHSEHQTGLAIDLGKKQNVIDFIRPDFPYEGICQSFREMAAEYGFVERYPKGREQVTGIGHEPWHFRYVGMPHAAIMKQNHLTLEEYLDFLRQYPYGERPFIVAKGGQEMAVSFLKASGTAGRRLELDMQMPYTVSGNNADGFIITEWRRLYA